MFWKWPISIIGKMLNIGADNRSTPNMNMHILFAFHFHYVKYSLLLMLWFG